MKNKLNNWAAALRVFWGITAALALFSGIIIAYVSENYLWIVYCTVGAASSVSGRARWPHTAGKPYGSTKCRS